MKTDFFMFCRTTKMHHFMRWIRSRGTIDRIKQLEDDQHGCCLFGLFDGFEKRGLIRLPKDKMQVRQTLIEEIKFLNPNVVIRVKKLGEL